MFFGVPSTRKNADPQIRIVIQFAESGIHFTTERQVIALTGGRFIATFITGPWTVMFSCAGEVFIRIPHVADAV